MINSGMRCDLSSTNCKSDIAQSTSAELDITNRTYVWRLKIFVSANISYFYACEQCNVNIIRTNLEQDKDSEN
jgi:hypothetical protein